mmetsp:Transcript_26807/g.75483  ORF Transcript_26807/g.75483 Transcript_26807/m.75483 type:complete len:299 (+) Transcript_26807:104-1000(+)|eukprot:CAMPEP_0117662030 /NCGR_PEP_ID=MMETSP0804-20121206/7844_1 /TAXON_ID=1074897 /ORGANISM="Tetraselmis astigmatica, Strain CCMP880" /LENGTH=298 /DNA_ID=CAMNT_0005468919 /DNA_START=29 /DNA_END=925 /DNA_ORIENTATION=-
MSLSLASTSLGSSRVNAVAVVASRRASRASRCRLAGRRLLAPARSQGEPEDFKRNLAQEALKSMDDAVRGAQRDLGNSINEILSPLGKALGMGDGKQTFDGAAPKSKNWAATQAFLKSQRLEGISSEAAQELLKEGYVMVVVQPSEDFAKFHPTGSVNVPLYRYLNNITNPMQAVRKIAYAAQAVTAIEDNPNFSSELREAAKSAKGLIFACNAGGTIRETPNFPVGQPSRSLIACSLALQDPELANLPVLHLQGGLNIYFRQGFEGEGENDEWEDTSGRVPYVPGFSADQDAKELMM